MKKLNLKQIIREAIKELVAEQTPQSGCIADDSAVAAVQAAMPTPQLGDHGITPQFVNNMNNKSTNFYMQRATAFINKAIQLNGGTGTMMCQGKNPKWQAMLINRQRYALNCHSNPTSCSSMGTP
mgnify:CR=1 FL=1